MSADDDLRINTIHRFAKHSPRLVLREYSHCEVPAGCGGVVLRWTDPRLGLPVFVSALSANAVSDLWLDGAPMTTGSATLASGAHVLALHVRRAPDTDDGRLLLALGIRTDVTSDAPEVLEGRFDPRFTTDVPPTSFFDVGFDDTGWSPTAHATAEEIKRAPAWARRRFENMNASTLAFDGEAWVRVRFDLDVTMWQGPSGGPRGAAR